MNFDKRSMRRIFLLIVGGIVFGWLILDTERATTMLDGIWALFSPFVAGAAIAFIFNVPMRSIERRLGDIRRIGVRRGFSIIATILSLILVITLVFELLIPQIQLTWASLAESIPPFVERTSNELVVLMDNHPDLKLWLQESFNLQSLDWASIVKDALTFLGSQLSTVMGSAVNVIGNVTGAIVNTVISIAFAVYCLIRKEILARQGRRILYSVLREHTADEVVRIARLTNNTFANFISGQFLEACILGVLFAIAMAIFRMPYIPLVSVIIAVTALVPVVGAFVGCVVGAFFILVNDPIQALSFVAMFLVLQQLENNLIYPRVVGTSIGLPGMWVLVAVTVGGGLMGVGGMLLMIPLASVLYTLVREFTDKRLAERNIPPEKLLDQPPELRSHLQQKRERKRLQKMKEQLQKIQNQKK